jgi:thioredoxin-like negative regulator of GroEL
MVEHGKYSKASEELQTILAANPNDGLIHYYQAICLHHLGRSSAAADEYAKALELSTDPVTRERCTSILKHFSALGIVAQSAKPANQAADTSATNTSANSGTYYLPHGIKLVYFYNPACKTCRAFSAVFDKAKATLSYTIDCIALDLGAPENERLVKQYDIEFYPTLVVLNEKGSEVSRIEGAVDEAGLQSFVNKGLSKCAKKR